MGRDEDSGRDPVVSSGDPISSREGGASYIRAPCPVCAHPHATLRTIALDVPFFGEVFESVFLCGHCGFRHADTLLPRVQEAVEFSLRIEGERDLFVRAIKSSSATVSIPELGLLWEPGPASLAEVTNVEGLIVHFEDAVSRAKALFPEARAQARADELMRVLEAVRDGKRPVTLVVKDPYGNSALIGDGERVKRRVLGADEASSLVTGEYILEASGDGKPAHLRLADKH